VFGNWDDTWDSDVTNSFIFLKIFMALQILLFMAFVFGLVGSTNWTYELLYFFTSEWGCYYQFDSASD